MAQESWINVFEVPDCGLRVNSAWSLKENADWEIRVEKEPASRDRWRPLYRIHVKLKTREG